MKQFAILLFILCLTVGIQSQVITQQMTAAFDAAIQEVVADTDFQTTYSNSMLFPVPICSTSKPVWPSTNPFASRSKIRLCFELGTQDPWLTIKKTVGQYIIKKINAKYGTSYAFSYTQYNTTMGYFPTLKKLVDDGECDIITSNATPLPERTAVAHFQCNYGTGSNGFLRSLRNQSISITDVNQLNSPDMIVGAYDGTVYSTYVKTNLPKATYIPFTSAASSYQGVLDNSVHAIIGDAIQYRNWMSLNGNSCKGCSVSLFGDSYGFATFTAQNYTSNANSYHQMVSNNFNIGMLSVLIGLIISFIF